MLNVKSPKTKQSADEKTDREHKLHLGRQLVAVGLHRDRQAFTEVYDYYAGRVKSFLLGKGMNEARA